jgi:glycosyltransferase involved in cell wall biosynthesis
VRLGQNPAKSIESVPQPQNISVAVVTYIPFLNGYYAQAQEVLKACLESLWAHTPLPHDLLVFDNASCPEVRAYLEQAHQQGRIQYLVLSQSNVGKGGAWNFIFQAAPGEFIAYADSDILFRPGWLEQSLAILQAFPKAGMVTARPMRTPEKFYNQTLDWARQAGDVQVDNGSFISWEAYREHVLSLGTGEEEARQWYDSRSDWRLRRQGVSALIGAAHFQFTARKAALAEFLPFKMDRPMGQVRSLDEQMNAAGYLRLATLEPLVKHMGNQIEAGSPHQPLPSPRAARLWDYAPLKKALLRLYDSIFRLYHT